MTKKSHIYTKSGDDGTTGLVSGARVLKSIDQIDLYGEVDELNSHLGHAISLLKKFDDYSKVNTNLLERIQSALFDLGSNLACEKENRAKFQLPQVSEQIIHDMESEIDQMDSKLVPLKNFILPSGTLAGSYFHVVRTVCRRVERKLVGFSHAHTDNLTVEIKFINRLSDFVFVLSRFVNAQNNQVEQIWKKS
jgi:cob(I)alamin adenosyltransferase